MTEHKQRIRQLTLFPFDDGRFEVFINGEKIYSKKETGKFPKYEEIRSAVEQIKTK